MTALNSVKTLPATMLETERDEVSAGAPRLRSRATASALDSPRSLAASVLTPVPASLTSRRTRYARLFAPSSRPDSIGCRPDGVEAWTESRLLGHRPGRGGCRRAGPGPQAGRLRVGLGGGVLR